MSAPSSPFLTALDPRQAVEGSRDPLGLQPMWSTLGRQLVGNLTTVATSVRGFTTLMLGLEFANRLVDAKEGDEAARVEAFLKFEQLAAYSRYAWQAETGDGVAGLRGIRRVSTRFARASDRLWISNDRDGRILGEQKTYGLWGLYSVPARDSGLREKAIARLTFSAGEHARGRLSEALRAHKLRDGDAVVALLAADQNFDPRGKHKAIGRCLADLHLPRFTADESVFYRDALLLGGKPAEARQGRLWACIDRANDDDTWPEDLGMHELRRIRAAALPGDEDIVERLDWIEGVESVLAPWSYAFQYVLASHGVGADEVADGLSKAWGTGLPWVDVSRASPALDILAGATTAGTPDRLRRGAVALRGGKWREVVDGLLAQNAAVMDARGSGPWARVVNDKLDVRFRGDAADLPSPDDLRDTLVNPYYLGALKTVGRTLTRPALGDRSEADE